VQIARASARIGVIGGKGKGGYGHWLNHDSYRT
jgi:hypothetical protein